jgi:hypothetical protein
MIIADKDPGYGIRLSGVGRLGSMEVGGVCDGLANQLGTVVKGTKMPIVSLDSGLGRPLAAKAWWFAS